MKNAGKLVFLLVVAVCGFVAAMLLAIKYFDVINGTLERLIKVLKEKHSEGIFSRHVTVCCQSEGEQAPLEPNVASDGDF